MRAVTIFMSDLRGSTAMADRMGPQEVIASLKLYLEAMVEVIGVWGGTIDEIVTGTTVNMAGRSESYATPGQILVSEQARACVGAELRIDGDFEIEPKGSSERLELHDVGGIGARFGLAIRRRTRSLRPLDIPLP